MRVQITSGKFAKLAACSDQRGIIAALAVDHRGNLMDAIAQARGTSGQATAEDMLTFKSAVTRVLTAQTSAILLDPEYSLEAIASRASATGVLLAYERFGYDVQVKGRFPALLPEWSVRRLVEAGAQGIKILLHYNPFDTARINTIKQAYVERIGAECTALDVPFFLEPLVYDDEIGDEKGANFASKKPEYVEQAMREFSHARYGVDILKVEMPVNPAFVSGTRAFAGGEAVYSRQEAIAHFRRAAEATNKPFIYLSAGTSNEAFCEMLELAAEAGVLYSGILCGRATWQNAITVYARKGVAALEDWLADQGLKHIQAMNNALAHGAVSWRTMYEEVKEIR
jgi:tagatose 1,6-diphosphate aldolase